jgi:uncharacterized protein YcnI
MRSLRGAALAVAFLVVAAVPAAAHVTVNPREVAPGSYAKLAFRVPNGRDDAATVQLAVELPAALDGARTRPIPGWTVAVEGRSITWSGGRIEPGEFQEFEISVGPLPDDGELVFKTRQTYDDGDVVGWIETTTGDEEPEHPAPVLQLVAPASAAVTDEATDEATDDDDSSPLGAYALAAAAALVSLVALARTFRRTT